MGLLPIAFASARGRSCRGREGSGRAACQEAPCEKETVLTWVALCQACGRISTPAASCAPAGVSFASARIAVASFCPVKRGVASHVRHFPDSGRQRIASTDQWADSGCPGVSPKLQIPPSGPGQFADRKYRQVVMTDQPLEQGCPAVRTNQRNSSCARAVSDEARWRAIRRCPMLDTWRTAGDAELRCRINELKGRVQLSTRLNEIRRFTAVSVNI